MATSTRSSPLAGSQRPRPSTHVLVGPADATQQATATLVVRRKPGAPELPDMNYWQNTPLRKQRILSVAEYTRIYGASPEDLATVAASFSSLGMTVLNSHAGRRTITVQGTVVQMNAAFEITLNMYNAPLPSSRLNRSNVEPAGTQRHLGYDGQLTLPAAVSGLVTAVVGLDNRCVGKPGGSSGSPQNSNSLQVPTIAEYYNFPNLQVPDQTVGVIAPSDPPTATKQRLSGYLKTDITEYYFPNLTDTAYSTPPASFNDIGLTVGANSYTNSTSTIDSANSTGFAQEVTQDICTSTTIAQGCNLNVYFTELSENGLLVCLNRILIPETEPQPTVVTCSFNFFGTDGSIGSPTDTSSPAYLMSEQFRQLASLGVNVFLISQDEGSNAGDHDGKTHVVYPGSDPWATCCGGTVVGDVQTGPPLTFEEYVWSDAGLSNPIGGFAGASGGGASATFPIPPYQAAAGLTQIVDTSNNKSSNRFVPDVAGMVSYSGFYLNGVPYPDFTGTSCVAPLYAGLFAVLRSALGVAFGFLNPILYELQPLINDITVGNNDPADGSGAPYYLAAQGWDACTGLGSIDGTKLLNGIASLLYSPNYYFQVNKGSFGLDEVKINASYSSPTPLWLVLEGFTPSAVTQAAIAPTIFSSESGITVAVVGGPEFEIATALNTPQRAFLPCSITFAASAINTIANNGIFPPPGSPPTPTQVLLVASQVEVAGQILPAAETTLTLEPGADPFFANFANNGEFYLSQDLRVFTVTPGINPAPIDGVVSLNDGPDHTNWKTTAGYAYIGALLNHLNSAYSDTTGTDPFTLFPDQTSALSGDSSVTPTSINPASPTGTPYVNYNFAVARVRLDGAESPTSSSGANVRVLFRLFASQTGDTDFQPTTYPSTNDSEGQPLDPELGVGNVTIPFFATGNYESNSDYQQNVDYVNSSGQPVNSINNQPVQIGASGQVWAYYGCYLNIYPTSNTINLGPPLGAVPVQSLLPSSHSCVVAQLIYDDAPAPTGPGVLQGPEYSDNFAQRNLQITFSDNPGPAAAHRIPQTFDVRPGPAPGPGPLEDYPDELMIAWGDTPVGSLGSIYWPAVSSADVLALAKQFYSTHQLSAADAHTIQCVVPKGFTFVPIPAGTGENFAGLFTVDLPQGVISGQTFTIAVRRISTYRPGTIPTQQPKIERAAAAAKAEKRPPMRNWRYVVGTFAVRIPVTTAKTMLPLEENTLSIMKWRLSQMAPPNRWIPVLKRYIGLIEGRVGGLGGNPGSIKPSPWGAYGPPPLIEGGEGGARHHATGKVNGLVYDRFGDFEGFLLLTEEGDERAYYSHEAEIEALTRYAWVERVVITVMSEARWPEKPVNIILRRAPPQPNRPGP
jgi:hypothetical protein